MTDEQFMEIAIREAKRGVGRTSPNPAVGAVIVKNGQIVSKGYHKKAGTPHAEINAIYSATEDLVGATMYVTLEPCSHTGRTGPCCEAIAKVGIERVVIGMTDPNPLVNGGGIDYLLQHGVHVTSGVREKECEDFNQPFIKRITTSMPFMVMKAGVSLDGKLSYQPGTPGMITGSESKVKVHQLRDRYDAILVGSGTVKADNPSLTTRFAGKNGRDPIRIIVDTHLTTSLLSKVYIQDSLANTIVMCSERVSKDKKKEFYDAGVTVVLVEEVLGKVDLKRGLEKVAELDISSILVEGGSKIHGNFLQSQLYDYAYLFYAPVFAGNAGQKLLDGMSEVRDLECAPRLQNPKYEVLGEDIMIEGKVWHPNGTA